MDKYEIHVSILPKGEHKIHGFVCHESKYMLIQELVEDDVKSLQQKLKEQFLSDSAEYTVHVHRELQSYFRIMREAIKRPKM